MAKYRKKAEAKVAGPAGNLLGGEKAKDFKGTMRQLLLCLKPYTLRLILVFVFAVASTVFTVLTPAILGSATDIITKGIFAGTGVDFIALRNIILLLIVLYILSFLFATAQRYIMAGVSQRVTYSLREGLSEKLDSLPIKYFDNKTHGEYQSRIINDIETINQTLSQSIAQIITGTIIIVGMCIMMIRISVLMSLVSLLALPLSMLVIRTAVKKSQGHFNNQQKFLGEVNGHVEEMYTGHSIVKLFCKEKESQDTFDGLNEKLCESAWKSQFISGLMNPITQLIGNLVFVLVCILGGYIAVHEGVSVEVAGLTIVLSRAVSIGNIQAFVQYASNINHPLQQVANVVNLLQSTAAAAERIFEVINEDEEEDAFNFDRGIEGIGTTYDKEASRRAKKKLASEAAKQKEEKKTAIADHADGIKGRIDFDHVAFGYNEEDIIIKDFNFTAEEGERIAIVGPTGAGKTTLVKLLLRYYELNKGSISIDGRNIKDFERGELRSLFGMVLQDTWLFSGSIRDNIKYGKANATEEEVVQAAKAAHIDHYVNVQPEGYDTLINEDASNLSQGQKQLLTIARAMLADNPILILDEATSSVDTRTEKLIQEAMARLMKGRTSFIIAHRLSTIKDADKILVLDKGDIVEQGTHEELLALNGFYSKLYNSQFAGK